MNERIRLLAEQAGMRECSLGYGMPENVLWGEDQIENFAELIVKECIDQISVNHDPNSDWDWEVSRGHAIAIIKEHFGVE
jgi:hypothetical protein